MLDEQGFVLAINHEPLSFLRRAGYAAVDQERIFFEDHKEENIQKLAQNGCDIVRMHFYKGAGVKYEKDEIEMTREYVKLCHKYGIKVQLYIQFGTLQAETMLAEAPGMMDWIQVDEHGNPITLIYGYQAFRYYPCFNKPGYWDYLENIIRLGILDIGGDLIGFDNISTAEEPVTCHCDSCKEGFVKFLKDKYRPDTQEGIKLTRERFGHIYLDNIRPPVWNYMNHPYNYVEINNPVIQEWVLFRCESLKRIVKRLYDFCKSLRKDIFVEYNAYKHFGTNTAFIHGIYLPDLKDSMDAFWNECDPYPEYTKDGRLLNRVRGFKMARAMDKLVFSGCGFTADTGKRMLCFAESMAFNRGIINGVEQARSIYSGKQTDFLKYRQFRIKHSGVYRSVPFSGIAVYESKPSLSFNNYNTFYSAITMNQCLLCGHIPYDLLLSLDNLEKYRVVILPNMECLTDNEIVKLKTYVENGGGLVIADDSGEFDEWRRRRGDKSLLNALGIKKRKGTTKAFRYYTGKGKVVYIPSLRSDRTLDFEHFVFKPFASNQPMVTPEYWKEPVNQDEIINAIKWVANDLLPFELQAPRHVVAELQRKADNSMVFLHLLNYDIENKVEDIWVRFNHEVIGNYGKVTLLLPDSGEERAIKPERDGWIVIPELERYAVISIEIRGEVE